MKMILIVAMAILGSLCGFCNGYCITSAIEDTNTPPAPPSDSYIENIIIDKMDAHHIYSKSGKVFTIMSNTKIINRHNTKIQIRTAELLFRAGKLVRVTIK